MEHHNQVAGRVYRNICTDYGLEAPRSKWKTSPQVVENDQAKILWDFQIQTGKLMTGNQMDIVLIDKQQKKAVVRDVATSGRRNTRNSTNIKG